MTRKDRRKYVNLFEKLRYTDTAHISERKIRCDFVEQVVDDPLSLFCDLKKNNGKFCPEVRGTHCILFYSLDKFIVAHIAQAFNLLRLVVFVIFCYSPVVKGVCRGLKTFICRSKLVGQKLVNRIRKDNCSCNV